MKCLNTRAIFERMKDVNGKPIVCSGVTPCLFDFAPIGGLLCI